MTDSSPAPSLFEPGRNCWRVEPASRVAFVIDADHYFRAARAAMERARRSILLLAWDYHPRVCLEPGADGADGPQTIGALFEELVRTRPDLEVRVLKWNLALLFTPARKMLPIFVRDGITNRRLRLRLDGQHPTGACQHQKVLVIDDAIAFCGGIDFAGNRWDTRAHPDHEPRRRRPNGKPYAPHHDMMLAVDGAAAAALGDLARERWRRATGERLTPLADAGDAWPDGVLAPDLHEVEVALARTAPAYGGREEIREVQALYLDAIARARDALYFESQYLTCPRIADALAARLAEPDGPEIVVINPKRSPSWLEQETMDAARDLAVARLREADRHDRFRIWAAVTRSGEDIIVHAKAMVVDDRLVRIGSANLSRRSMGFDSECDLAIEAPEGAGSEAVREAIRDFRDGLVAEHLRVPIEAVRGALAEHGSLVRAIESLRGRSGADLLELPPTRVSGAEDLASGGPVDPEQPEPRTSYTRLLGRVLRRLGTPAY